jgi:hypothetical protein
MMRRFFKSHRPVFWVHGLQVVLRNDLLPVYCSSFSGLLPLHSKIATNYIPVNAHYLARYTRLLLANCICT